MSHLIHLVGTKRQRIGRLFEKTVLCELQSSDTLDRATRETTDIRGEKEIERSRTFVKLSENTHSERGLQDKKTPLIRMIIEQ